MSLSEVATPGRGVEIAVIARCRQGHIGEADCLCPSVIAWQTLPVLFRSVDGYLPFRGAMVAASAYDFTPDFHQKVRHSIALEHRGHEIAAIAFGDGREIEAGADIMFDKGVADKSCARDSHEAAQ